MKPTTDFSQFDKNPFESIVSSGKNQAATPQGNQQMGPQMMAQEMMGKGTAKMPPNQMDYGSVGGTTPALTSALQAMQKFISESQDGTEIAIGRTIITLLTKLIAADQQKQAGQLPQGGQVSQQGA